MQKVCTFKNYSLVTKQGTKEVHIELYTDCKDLSAEQKVEAVLDKQGIFYEKSEVWIESEKLYEVLYSFEMEV